MKTLVPDREGLLRCLTVLYLAFPIFLFIGGWLRWEIGLPVIVLALGGFWAPFISRTNFREGWKELIPSVPVFILVIGLVWISGAAGIFCQRVDWLKHNSILFDLVSRPWPVFYEGASGGVPMIYYLGYYLPAALFGKCFGMTGAFGALFVWTVCGFLLVVAWLKVFIRHGRGLWVVMAFLFFSGWDIVGNAVYHIVYHYFLNDPLFPWYRGEGWSGLLQYSSHLNWLFWVPQHALSCWLCTALILEGFNRKNDVLLSSIIFCAGYSMLWSPFVSLGLAPIILIRLSGLGTLREFRPVFSLHGFASAVVGGILLLFFASKMGPTPYPLPPIPSGLVFDLPGDPGNISVVVMKGLPAVVVIARVLVFIFLEIGVFVFPLWFLLRDDAARKKLLLGVVAWLMVLPWFYYGLYNDLVMRASGPALFVLVIFGLQEMFPGSPRSTTHRLLILIWIIGSIAPVITLGRQLSIGMSTREDAVQPVVSLEKSMLHQKEGGFFNAPFAAQYIGRSDSFFFRFLATKEK